MRKSIYILVAIFMAATMVLSSCGPTATTVAPATSIPATAVVPPTAVPTQSTADIAGSLPRNETMYFNGQQWGAVVCWNPYANSCNNAMAIAPAGQRPCPHVRNPV
jgi:peptide/nickel transport system substrate-binding protein